jgi:hypothetical protein
MKLDSSKRSIDASKISALAALSRSGLSNHALLTPSLSLNRIAVSASAKFPRAFPRDVSALDEQIVLSAGVLVDKAGAGAS